MLAGSESFFFNDPATPEINTLSLLDALPTLAEQFTVVLPTGNVEPEAGTHVTATKPATQTVEVPAQDTFAPPGPVASTAMFAGSESAGAVGSTTLTVNEPWAVLPNLSLAEQF